MTGFNASRQNHAAGKCPLLQKGPHSPATAQTNHS